MDSILPALVEYEAPPECAEPVLWNPSRSRMLT